MHKKSCREASLVFISDAKMVHHPEELARGDLASGDYPGYFECPPLLFLALVSVFSFASASNSLRDPPRAVTLGEVSPFSSHRTPGSCEDGQQTIVADTISAIFARQRRECGTLLRETRDGVGSQVSHEFGHRSLLCFLPGGSSPSLKNSFWEIVHVRPQCGREPVTFL